MTRPVRFRFVVVVVVSMIAISSLVVVFHLLGPGPTPIVLNVLRLTHQRSGTPLALVQLTNRTRINFNYSFWTEMLSNGVWVDALNQHPDARTTEWLQPHHQRTLEVPVPREGSAWRIALNGARVLGRFEMLVYRVSLRLKVPYPIARELNVYSQTNEIVAVPNPQGSANESQSFDSGANGTSASAAPRR